MLASTYTPGWGYGYGHGFGQAQPTFAQYFSRFSAPQPPTGLVTGFGQPVSDFNAFNNGQSLPASFVGDPAGFGLGNVVFCNKEANTNRVQCVLNQTGDGAKAPIRRMQQAVDRLITLVNAGLRGQLSDDQLCAEFPREDGSGTFSNCARIGEIQDNPIATGGGGGIDGIVGDSTRGPTALAITFAGALKQIPNRNVAIAFINPLNNGILAEMSSEVAEYLNDVSNNFDTLVTAFKARNNQPVQTALDPTTIEALPFVKPGATRGPQTGLIIGTAAAMVGLTALAAVSAARHKPAMAYEDSYRPALGRGRRGRRSRSW